MENESKTQKEQDYIESLVTQVSTPALEVLAMLAALELERRAGRLTVN